MGGGKVLITTQTISRFFVFVSALLDATFFYIIARLRSLLRREKPVTAYEASFLRQQQLHHNYPYLLITSSNCSYQQNKKTFPIYKELREREEEKFHCFPEGKLFLRSSHRCSSPAASTSPTHHLKRSFNLFSLS